MRRGRRDRAGRRSITSWLGVRVANAGTLRIFTPLTPVRSERFIATQLMIATLPLFLHYLSATQKLGSQKSTSSGFELETAVPLMDCYWDSRAAPPAAQTGTQCRGAGRSFHHLQVGSSALARDRLDRRGRYPEGCIRQVADAAEQPAVGQSPRLNRAPTAARRQCRLYASPMTCLPRTRFHWRQ